MQRITGTSELSWGNAMNLILQNLLLTFFEPTSPGVGLVGRSSVGERHSLGGITGSSRGKTTSCREYERAGECKYGELAMNAEENLLPP